VQALLEAAGLPYAGSRVAASALALDKSRTKFAYQARGLSTPVFAPRWRGRSDEEVLAEAIAFGGPWVVKANGEGSSFGVHLADDAEAVRAALAVLEGEALVERRIRGREFTCGILEALDGTAKPLPVTEMITEATARFFDFEAKYSGRTQEVTPAEISEDLRDRIQALALEAHRVLGCRHLSRTDVMQDENGRPSSVGDEHAARDDQGKPRAAGGGGGGDELSRSRRSPGSARARQLKSTAGAALGGSNHTPLSGPPRQCQFCA